MPDISQFDRVKSAIEGWTEATSDLDLMNRADLPGSIPPSSASVLIPIIAREGEANVILTRRTTTVKHHAGQISFPGGRMEEQDKKPESTALREAQEEIGLDPRNVEILGRGPLHETSTGFLIAPIVGRIISDFSPVLQEDEVAEVFEVPLLFLADLGNYRIECREWRGAKRYFYVIDFRNYRIWGATARILYGMAERLSV
ncbi:MAG: CoA pyrophosphatase [Albidovulum sp.]|nr:CoA pyrophosphatase [Albidovulum sp.]MDE0306085.1 CoA pyrophosphatase [Albidovulum sp.]MDE0531794.1 CoA pyrophosphatase [Albidovulum sp.]